MQMKIYYVVSDEAVMVAGPFGTREEAEIIQQEMGDPYEVVFESRQVYTP